MIGQGRPIRPWAIAACIAMATWAAACAGVAAGEDVNIRLRVAWGGGPQASQTWTGVISAGGAELTAMRPLGIEADEAAALRLVGNEVLVEPIVARAFDGCDITIHGDAAAVVTVRLKNASQTEAKDITVALGELAAAPFRTPLDEQGGFLLIQRAPGDTLRVRLDRDHLVFGPSEPFKLTVEPALGKAPAGEPLSLTARLQSVSGGRVIWETSAPFDPAAPSPIELQVPTPAAEGAYRISLALQTHAGFASKLQLWQQKAPAAARDVEFVVIDPAARLPRLTGKWETIQSIDPANPKWWQRVPEWTQLDRLPVLSTPRSFGNVKVVVQQAPTGRYVELPAPQAGADASWQAYPLAIQEVGQPHIVEIDLPAGAPQQLAVSILEPDAAGRVMSFGREAGVYVDRRLESADADAAAGGLERHRLVFWPRTASPILLLANQSTEHAAAYGAIRVGRRETLAAEPVAPLAIGETAANDAAAASERTVAAYVSLPRFADCMGGAEELDATSNLSVKGWGAFLEATTRLAQELRAGGYNAAVISIAAEGSSLAPLAALGASPKYDTGPLASSGADALPKDVLEALLRVFDREGLRVIPVVELATPLPALESLRRGGDSRATGVECVTFDGRTWDEHTPGQAAGAHYNVLNAEVQEGIAAAVDELIARYGGHASLGGVAVQLSGRGYGVLPGMMWGLDDATLKQFAEATGSVLPLAGDQRFQKRAELLSGPFHAAWVTWRQREVTAFYAELAKRVQVGGARRKLVLCSEDLFAGAEATRRLRQALNGRASLDEAAAELGVDFAALASTPGVCALRPRRLASDELLQARALDLLINNAGELDQTAAAAASAGELHFYEAQRLRLASFDAVSPFGAERTNVAMNMSSYAPGDAARRPLASALASHDFFTLVEGGEQLPLTHDADAARLRRLLQELPGGDAEVLVQREQPITLRVYRTSNATTVCVVNDSAWATTLELPLDSGESLAWRDLGVDNANDGVDPQAPAPAEPTAGMQAAGVGLWRLTLPAYGVAARRFDSRALKIGALEPSPPAAALADLAARIKEIEQRSLDVERPYPELQNPNFELGAAEVRMLGWQPRIGKSGRVEITAADAVDGVQQGGRMLHLRSEDTLGVAAQSQLFQMPASGQLTIRARVRAGEAAADVRMFVWIEGDAISDPPTPYLPREGWRLNGDWSTCEVSFDDLPLASSGQMRIQFHLVGRGEAWVDDVELFDLRFGDGQRKELAKRLLAAKAALDDGQVADCQRLVEGYWPRFLVEYLPAAEEEPIVRIATRPEDAPVIDPPAEPGIGDRVRGIFKR